MPESTLINLASLIRRLDDIKNEVNALFVLIHSLVRDSQVYDKSHCNNFKRAHKSTVENLSTILYTLEERLNRATASLTISNRRRKEMEDDNILLPIFFVTVMFFLMFII